MVWYRKFEKSLRCFVDIHHSKWHERVDHRWYDVLLDHCHHQVQTNDHLQPPSDQECCPNSTGAGKVQFIAQSGSKPKIINICHCQVVRPGGGFCSLVLQQQFLLNALIPITTYVLQTSLNVFNGKMHCKQRKYNFFCRNINPFSFVIHCCLSLWPSSDPRSRDPVDRDAGLWALNKFLSFIIEACL